MDSGSEQPSQSCEDTLPEIPTVVGRLDDQIARTARQVRRRRAVRQVFEAGAEFAKDAPEIVLELITGLWP